MSQPITTTIAVPEGEGARLAVAGLIDSLGEVVTGQGAAVRQAAAALLELAAVIARSFGKVRSDDPRPAARAEIARLEQAISALPKAYADLHALWGQTAGTSAIVSALSGLARAMDGERPMADPAPSSGEVH